MVNLSKVYKWIFNLINYCCKIEKQKGEGILYTHVPLWPVEVKTLSIQQKTSSWIEKFAFFLFMLSLKSQGTDVNVHLSGFQKNPDQQWGYCCWYCWEVWYVLV